ncbi:MAG: hypothetical protein A2Y21_05400 [Clostridiales bacterium GWC2_40_7]|nr:MAG: hypothetical protein A2Y21_05400 [Clostridiales bacterium GWC2_40_7]
MPEFVFVEGPHGINDEILKKFGKDVVIKIVSPDIAHKSKLGGVKKIKNDDSMFVKFVLTQMKEEVLSHFDEANKPRIDGFLISEYIEHTQSLGYELLIGFKEDAAFGPVLTLSKGGGDAEFFAKYYDPANLYLPPISCDKTLKKASTLKIRHKFKHVGHPEYLERFAKAASIISELAYHFSFIAEKESEYIIKTIEVNPFVFAQDNRFVAIDGFGQFVPVREDRNTIPAANLENIDKFFKPERIAVIGVSSNSCKYSMAREIVQLMLELGRDDLYLVNDKGGVATFEGKEYLLYKSFSDITEKVDLAVYAAPAAYIEDFIRTLGDNGPKALILIPSLTSTINYNEFTKQLDVIKPKGLRILGPNCMGVFMAPDSENKGVNTLFIDEERMEIGYSDFSNTVLLSQSGGLAVTTIDKLKNAKVLRTVVSFGNKYDVKIIDLMSYFAQDNSIAVIALYLEGLGQGEGRCFYQLAGEIAKPVIVYKAGKTDAGAKAAASHTASMSGDYDVFKAACVQSGIILAEGIEDYYNYVKAFSLLAKKIPSGNRVAGVLNAGFETTIGADEIKNLEMAKFSDETIEKLEKINKHGLVDVYASLLDVTAMTDDSMYAEFVEALLQDEGVDCLLVAVIPHVVSLKTTPDTCHDPDGLANLLAGLAKKYNKPMVVSVNAGQYYQEFVTIMEENGLPVYNEIRSAVKALDTFVSWHM